ncbi:hypothetical protein BGX31_009057 [Mortierella sp. GBA43]|nr:hypothetical protein BGX31_009057 [Mortierella sp. GBA43]
MISTLSSNHEQDLIRSPLQHPVAPTSVNDQQSVERSSIVTTATVAQGGSTVRKYSAQFHKNGLPIKSALKSPTATAVDDKASPLALCRPSSIRTQTSLTPLKSPKYVHFNTQLEHVRFFLQGEMPSCVSERETILDARQSDLPTSDIKLTLPNWSPTSIDTFNPTNNGSATPVRLGNAFLSEDQSEIEGEILVHNLAFHKHVSVRFTIDFWKTNSEVSAEFEESIHGSIDRFSFVIPLNMELSSVQKTLCMAVRYQVNGREFWDSNNGMNYHVECNRVVVATSPVPDLTKRMNSLLIGTPLPDYSTPVLKKKQANRYDFSTSLSATRSPVVKSETTPVTSIPINQAAYRASEYIMPSSPSQNYHHTLYASSPKFINPYMAAASPPDHFHLGYDQLSLDRTFVNKKAPRDNWGVEVDTSSTKGSAPISIPMSKSQMSRRPAVGSSTYFDLVEQWCFYESSPNISPYSSYSSSPSAPCIRG